MYGKPVREESLGAQTGIAVWPQYARRGYDLLLHLRPYRRLLRQIIDLAEITDGLRVLDVGCGTGNLVVILQELGLKCRVVGIDASPDMLELARAKGQRYQEFGGTAEFYEGNLDQPFNQWGLPSDAGLFDVVVSNNVLYALARPGQTIGIFASLLCPGGRLVFSTPGPRPEMTAVFREHAKLMVTAGPLKRLRRWAASQRIKYQLRSILPSNRRLLADPSRHYAGPDTIAGWIGPAWRVRTTNQCYGEPPQNLLYVLELEPSP